MASGDTPPDALYAGWMAGYMHHVCSDFYFRHPPSLGPEERVRLLRALSTYRTLVDSQAPWDQSDIDAGLRTMTADVAATDPSARSVARADFELWHDQLLGALRAKLPSAFNAAGLAETVSELCQASTPPNVIRSDLRDKVRWAWLEKLKRAISAEAYDVILSDCQRLVKWVEEDPPNGAKRVARAMRGHLRDQWADLVLGQRTAADLLSKGERLALGAIAVLLAIGFGLGTALAVLLPVLIVLAVSHVSLSQWNLTSVGELLTNVQTLVGTITAAGVTLGVLAQKASRGFAAGYSFFAVLLAKRRPLELESWKRSASARAHEEQPPHRRRTAAAPDRASSAPGPT